MPQKLPRHIALINQKGGVGKTTTTANLAAALARAGRRVLVADLDPQAHLTMHFGVDATGDGAANLYHVLTDGTPLAEAVRTTSVENLRVLPSSIDLAAAEVELVGVVGREVLLRDALASFRTEPANAYDYLLLDCPPSLGLLTLNALSAASEVLICLQPHFLALQGVGKLLETVALVQQRINRSLTVSGVVLCMYDMGTRLAGEVTDDLSGFLAENRDRQTPWSAAQIFKTHIRRNIKLAECPSFGQVIFQYAPGSHGAEDYASLAGEVLAMEEVAAADASPGEDRLAAGTQTREPDQPVSQDAGPQASEPDPPARETMPSGQEAESEHHVPRLEDETQSSLPSPAGEQPPAGMP